MKKNGFTLVELLAVLTVLSIILLIAIPSLTNVINKSREKIIEDNIIVYGKAIEKAVANYFAKYPEKDEVTLEQLNNEGLLKTSGSKVECDIVQISKKKTYLSECTVNGKDVDIEYGKYDPAPELEEGLIPVEYKNDKWVVANEYSNTWYNYDEQKWANAVTLLPGITKEVGDEVKVDGTEASMMLVWIPRFEYKYTNLGNQYAGGTQEQPGGIEINLISKEKTEPSDESKYKIHPAFTFGDKELSGIWIGKFELSHTELASSLIMGNLGCDETTCVSDISKLRTLPNIQSLRYNSVSGFWYGIKSIENTSSFGLSNIDTHMIKNTEWAAVAYLSQSKYGKYGNKDYTGAQKEVYINNSSLFYTGRSGGNVGGSTKIKDTYTNETSTTTYDEQGFYTYDGYLIDFSTGNKTNTRDINKGTGASTTGNIYGVYDMSGSAYEYVMGAYGSENSPTISDSGFSSNPNVFTNGTINSKYYNIYANDTNKTSNDTKRSCNNGICYGHALSETYWWYNDSFYMVDEAYPWMVRGGTFKTSSVGIFAYNNTSAYSPCYYSTRVVFVKK